MRCEKRSRPSSGTVYSCRRLIWPAEDDKINQEAETAFVDNLSDYLNCCNYAKTSSFKMSNLQKCSRIAGLVRTKIAGDLLQDRSDLLAGHDELVNGVVERQDGQDILPCDVAGLDVGPIQQSVIVSKWPLTPIKMHFQHVRYKLVDNWRIDKSLSVDKQKKTFLPPWSSNPRK